MQRRLLVTQALEAARTVEEGVVTDLREADVGSIPGFGFAPFTGGGPSYIGFMGAKLFVDLCRRLQRDHGDRFRPEHHARRDGRQARLVLRPGAAQKAA